MLRDPFFLSADNDQSDDMPIIAVMVALSSLLVIIFIIIILYMLRLVNRADVTHDTLAFSCETWGNWSNGKYLSERETVYASLCINMDFVVCWLTGLKSTSRQEAIQTPSDWPMADQMIQVKHSHIRECVCFVCRQMWQSILNDHPFVNWIIAVGLIKLVSFFG